MIAVISDLHFEEEASDIIPATPDDRTFGRLQALTCLMLLSSSEDRKEGKEDTFGTFDYWTGYTRHWRPRK